MSSTSPGGDETQGFFAGRRFLKCRVLLRASAACSPTCMLSVSGQGDTGIQGGQEGARVVPNPSSLASTGEFLCRSVSRHLSISLNQARSRQPVQKAARCICSFVACERSDKQQGWAAASG